MTRRPAPPSRFPSADTGELELTDHLIDLGAPLAVALGSQAAPQPSVHTLRAISTVAHRAAAVATYDPSDPYPIHRPSPAPRCMYTSNLYFLSSGEVLARDLYLYHPLRHTLRALQCAPEHLPPGHDAWLVTLDTRRLAFKYADFAERLGRLEAGHLVAQLQACSAALGWDTSLELPPFGAFAARLPEHEQPVALLRYDTRPGRKLGGTTAIKTPDALELSFSQCVRQRGSGYGPNGVHPVSSSVPLEQVVQMAKIGLESGDPVCHVAGFGLRAVILNVQGLLPGIYEFNGSGTPHLIRGSLDRKALFAELFLGSGFIVEACPVVWFITAKVAQVFADAGPRAYDILMIGAGKIAHRIELCAAAYSQFARPCMNYDEQGIDYRLGCATTDSSVLCEVLMGVNRATSLSVRLDL